MSILDRLWEAYQERPFLSNTMQTRLDLSHDDLKILLDTLADMAENETVRGGYHAKRIGQTTYKLMTGRFHPDLAAQINATAEKLDWSIAEVINECVERDLPRLIEREKKRMQRRTSA